MLCVVIGELEEIIKNNRHTDHCERYDMFLKYLKYYKEKSAAEDSFEFEKGNFGIGAFNYLIEGIDPEGFYISICKIEKYSFDEFVLK